MLRGSYRPSVKYECVNKLDAPEKVGYASLMQSYWAFLTTESFIVFRDFILFWGSSLRLSSGFFGWSGETLHSDSDRFHLGDFDERLYKITDDQQQYYTSQNCSKGILSGFLFTFWHQFYSHPHNNTLAVFGHSMSTSRRDSSIHV